MSAEPEPEPAAAPATSEPPRIVKWTTRVLVGDEHTIAGTVYGTIIVLAVLAADARMYENHLWELDAVAAMTAVVLWLAHVYSHALGESVRAGRRLTLAEVRSIARREVSIVLAAIPPVIAILAGATGLIGQHAAYRIATGLGIAALTVQAIRYARLEHLSFAGTAIAIALNVTFGLAIVLAEVWVAH